MSIYKCKMCGGEFDVAEGTKVLACPYCGAAQNDKDYIDNYAQNGGSIQTENTYPQGNIQQNVYQNNGQYQNNVNNMRQVKSNNTAVIIVIIAAVLIAAAAVTGYFVIKNYQDNNHMTASQKNEETSVSDNKENPYNKKYIDVTGSSIEEIADELGMDLDEFLEEFGLPADMPGDTHENAALYTMPFKTAVEKIYDSDVETIKGELGITYDIPDDATYVEVIDKVALKYMLAQGQLDEFKEHYGFGDDVTENTLWGEVRQTVDKKNMEDRIAEENQLGEESGETDEMMPIG